MSDSDCFKLKLRSIGFRHLAVGRYLTDLMLVELGVRFVASMEEAIASNVIQANRVKTGS